MTDSATLRPAQRVTVTAPITTRSERARRNIEVIRAFFGSYLVDKPHFYSLWVEDGPKVITPFVTADVATCSAAVHDGWDAIRAFWDPIHDGMTGKFDWTVEEIMVGEDPDVIVTKATSDIDVTTSAVWGGKPLKYQGRYIQIFSFDDGRIKTFEEYYDTALLNSIYGA
ncbi:hypothetical protein EJC47_11270 [Sphingomonas sp. TF3]|uniref:nuclear transport factor 2 family protein n=1 Tax=Sphingomonas sp. TF3 TaxID=2495580 RepID=UPI000F86B770|nr:nuclear transport factor 2 family protein [Sphingomonas sp. TF3]RUN76542.1 hypothetical protein EJC47_11270 [Sphingomonas sp. TF3]